MLQPNPSAAYSDSIFNSGDYQSPPWYEIPASETPLLTDLAERARADTATPQSFSEDIIIALATGLLGTAQNTRVEVCPDIKHKLVLHLQRAWLKLGACTLSMPCSAPSVLQLIRHSSRHEQEGLQMVQQHPAKRGGLLSHLHS